MDTVMGNTENPRGSGLNPSPAAKLWKLELTTEPLSTLIFFSFANRANPTTHFPGGSWALPSLFAQCLSHGGQEANVSFFHPHFRKDYTHPQSAAFCQAGRTSNDLVFNDIISSIVTEIKAT